MNARDEPGPAQNRPEDWVPAFVYEQMSKRIPVREIESKLVERGLDAETAAAIARNLQSPAREHCAGQQMLLGASVCLGGLFLTLTSYTAAAPGETYVVAVGAILGGCLLFLAGLTQAGSGLRNERRSC